MSGPIKYHGGKWYLRSHIHRLAPKSYRTRVVPFAGGAQELWGWVCPHCGNLPPNHKDDCPGLCEIVADLNDDLINFFRVLRTPATCQLLMERLNDTLFSESEFNHAISHRGTTRLDRAWAFFVKYRMSRQGLGIDFATISTSRTRSKINEQVSAWRGAIDGLEECCERLRTLTLASRHSLKTLRAANGKYSFAYLDPPYHPSTRVAGEYEFEMTHEEHVELLEFLATKWKGKFLLSGYNCDLYEEYRSKYQWELHEVPQKAHSSSSTTKSTRTECFWRNYSD